MSEAIDNERSYNTLKKRIKSEIQAINQKLKDHEKQFKNNSDNWGYVGDLNHIAELLKEIRNFI